MIAAAWHDVHSDGLDNRRDNSAATSDRRGGSAPARPQVKAAQIAATGTTTLTPIATLLSDADAKFAAIQANAAL